MYAITSTKDYSSSHEKICRRSITSEEFYIRWLILFIEPPIRFISTDLYRFVKQIFNAISREVIYYVSKKSNNRVQLIDVFYIITVLLYGI